MFKSTISYEPYFYIACRVSLPSPLSSSSTHTLLTTERTRGNGRGVDTPQVRRSRYQNRTISQRRSQTSQSSPAFPPSPHLNFITIAKSSPRLPSNLYPTLLQKSKRPLHRPERTTPSRHKKSREIGRGGYLC